MMKNTKITDKVFAELFPGNLQEKLDKWKAEDITRKQFCQPVNFVGKCTGNCNNCQPYIADIFQRIIASTDIQNYEAVLTWHCKNTVARIKEQKEVEPYQPPVDAFDRPIDINPFQQFLQAIS